MSVFGKVVKGRSKVRCDGCGRISSDPQSGYYLDRKTQKGGNISSKGRECEHDFCSECEAKNTAPEGDCPKCGAQYPRAMPTPTPAPTEDARWLSPEARAELNETRASGVGMGPGTKGMLSATEALALFRHAECMDERLQQTWLAFTAERDLHNAAKTEIAAKDREIAELRRDRERLGWLSDRKTIMVQTIRVSECAGDVKELLADRCDQQRKTLREAIDAAMKETNAD